MIVPVVPNHDDKPYTASPPDVLRVDEKNLRDYPVFNVCGVIITTNHKAGGIFLPPDDRRHYVAWSPCRREDFDEGYWKRLGTGTSKAAIAMSPLISPSSTLRHSIRRRRHRRRMRSGDR